MRWTKVWVWTILGLLASSYWSLRIGFNDFAEPPQVAVVGHASSWRTTADKRSIVSVGRDRKLNDIALYDRKAAAVHFELERRGTGKRWWAILRNRSSEQSIKIRRAQTPYRVTNINRYYLKDGDRFFVPLFKKQSQSSSPRPRDACSPTSVKQWLLKAPIPSKKDSSRGYRFSQSTPLLAFAVQRSKLSLSIWGKEARMVQGKGKKKRVLWLYQGQRYLLPPSLGGGLLEYRHKGWQIQRQGRWYPLQKPLRWNPQKPREISLVRRPILSTRPVYRLGLASSPCSWQLKPQYLPAGIPIGRIATLTFKGSRLYIQHLGREDIPIQITPYQKDPRKLGEAEIFTGDYISVGRLTYRVTIDKDRIRLMITPPPRRYPFLFSFFNDYPSLQLPMRQWLPSTGTLLVTGGAATQGGAQHWRLPLPLAGIPGKTQITSPYSPIFSITRLANKKHRLDPPKDTPIYLATTSGKIKKKQLRAPTPISLSSSQLYYSQRLYFQIFQPSYQGLSWRIALFWFIVSAGAILFLHWLLITNRLYLFFLSPLSGHSRPSFVHWLSLPMLLLWPIAIFLNGLGLYVLATLSLSSLGLNNNSFLYRQLLWSMVGVTLFVAVTLYSTQGAKRLFASTRKTLPSFFVSLWERFFSPPPSQIQLHSSPPPKKLNRSIILGISAFYGIISLGISIAFQSWAVLLLAFLFYGYVAFWIRDYQRNRYHPAKRKSLRYFFITLMLLGAVPIIGLVIPPLVHNRFFLVIPGVGTAKISDFAILSAIVFFASYLGIEIFAIRRNKAYRDFSESTQKNYTSSQEALDAASDPPPPSEIELSKERKQKLGGALLISLHYLLLLGAIGALYTIQGDLGPGLILTLCFSLYLLFAFLGTGADHLTTTGNLIRIATVFVGFLLSLYLPNLLTGLFPEWALQSAQLQKVQERLALWNQPWRFIVGEQILQNLWDLAAYNGAFQWFSNLHSDFVLTAVVRVLSPLWGYLVIMLTCTIPLIALSMTRLYWPSFNPSDTFATLEKKKSDTIRGLIILFGGIYLFAQNFIHIGSVLRLTPMTGVTLSWVSSGGTSLIVCYLTVAMLHRQTKDLPVSETE